MSEKINDALDDSFDDDELKNIMSEIESLEGDLMEDDIEEDIIPKAEAKVPEEPVKEVSEPVEPVAEVAKPVAAPEPVEPVLEKPAGPEVKAEQVNENDLLKELGLEAESKPVEEGQNEGNLQDIVDKEMNNVSNSSLEEEVLGEFEEKNNVVEVKPQAVEEPVSEDSESEVIQMNDSSFSAPSTMDFNLSGQMNMNMRFHCGDTSVEIKLSGENGLSIELPGGIKFSVPTEEKKAS